MKLKYLTENEREIRCNDSKRRYTKNGRELSEEIKRRSFWTDEG